MGRWAGVPIRAHPSVLLMLAFFAYFLATSALPAVRSGQSTAAYWWVGSITAAAFWLTLLAHELAHAVTARHFGMRVERITLWALGGLTELHGEPPSPRADALIAGSGPAVSLVIGGACGAVAWWSGTSSLAVAAVAWLAGASVFLGVFNLLPAAPLDGGRLLRAWLWWRSHDRAKAAVRATSAGRVLGTALVVLGFLELLAGGWGGLWLALIGWFIVSGAAGERYAVSAEKLRTLTVREVMSPAPFVVADWWAVQHLLDQLRLEDTHQAAYPVIDFSGAVHGVLTLQDLLRVPPDRREGTRLRDIIRRPVLLVSPDVSMADLLLSLHLRGGMAVVGENGRPVGLVTPDDLSRAAALAELGWPAKHPGSRPDGPHTV
ncbi:site-2 protease family protein [Nakamurella panacisegetis]|nr:site-2 protease family protein [Nakamurella panacisegetis]